jgi:hypothetical protein
MKTGNLLKLKTNHNNNNVEYKLPLGDELIELNSLVGKSISLKFDGIINCLDTGRVIKKSFGQGYSWESFTTKASCDTCIFKPELCHYSVGTCREPKWGEEFCLKPHVIYLANSSELKVGITRETQVPTRWMDQGASFALPILKVKDRHTSGMIEVEIGKKLGDKTNWRKMLKGDVSEIDLLKIKKEVLKDFKPIIEKFGAEVLPDDIYEFNYPVEVYPTKVTTLSFDKTPEVSGILQGIKGQYLIFDHGVLNIRKHQGYSVSFEIK